jgi:ankyrin repeat protein
VLSNVVQLLRHGKVNVNIRDRDDNTALSLVSMQGHTEIVWLLLQLDPCLTLELALIKGHTKACRIGKTCREEKAIQRFNAERINP